MTISASLVIPRAVAGAITYPAPCLITFNLTGTTSTNTTKPFGECIYIADFNDPGAGTWSTGPVAGQNRNIDYGPFAAHVYETPGSYNPIFNIFDGVNIAVIQASDVPVTITVQDPDVVFAGNKTVCVSTDGDFTGAPSGSTNITSSDFDATFSANIGTTKRVMYRNGRTYVANQSTSVTATGPWLVSGFGTGAKAQINSSGNFGDDPIINCGSSSTVTQKGAVIKDLAFNGNGSAEAVGMGGGFDQVLCLRLSVTNSGDAGIFYNSARLNVAANPHLFDGSGVIDTDVTAPGAWCVFFNGKNFALMGLTLNNNGVGSHSLRVSIAVNGVIKHNTLGPNGPGNAGTHVLKLHGAPWTQATDGVPVNTATQFVVVSDNKLTPGPASTNNWTFSLDPQDSEENEHIQFILVERNSWVGGGPNTVLSISMQATDVWVRNNISNTTNCGDGVFVEVDKRSTGAPAPARVTFQNNSLFTNANNLNTSDTAFISITNSVASGTCVVQNNLGWAKGVSASAPLMIRDQASSTLANNSTNLQTKIDPLWVNSPAIPVNPADYQILTGSYAKIAGASVKNFTDFNLVYRPQGAGFSIGATEFNNGIPAPWSSQASVNITPNTGALSFAPLAPIVSTTGARLIVPNTGALALAATTPALFKQNFISPNTGGAAFTGIAPGDLTNNRVFPLTGSFALQGSQADVSSLRILVPGTGAMVMAPTQPVVSRSTGNVPGTGAIAITGNPATVSQSVVITVGTGSLAFTGVAPGRASASFITVPTAALSAQGQSALLSAAGSIAVNTGIAVMTGFAPVITRGFKRIPNTGSLGLAGQQSIVIYQPSFAITPKTGAMGLTGFAPTTFIPLRQPSTGHLDFTGYKPKVMVTKNMRPIKTGSMEFKGYRPIVTVTTTHHHHGPRVILRILAPFFRRWF